MKTPIDVIYEYRRNSNLNFKEFADSLSMSRQHLSSILNNQQQISPIVAIKLSQVTGYSPLFFLGKEPALQIDASIKDITDELIKFLSKHPSNIYELNPRQFEELVAAIFTDRGYKVKLTPQTHDNGRDILAVLNTPFDEETLTIIECKKFARNRHIGPELLRGFMWNIDSFDKANCGMFVTTSFFSQQAEKIQKENYWRLKLKDYDDLREWLANYGQWDKINNSNIYTPNILNQ